MASEEDNFDIDIYGDGGEDYHQGGQDDSEVKAETSTDTVVNMSEPAQQSTEALDGRSPATLNGQDSYQEAKAEESSENKGDIAQKIASTDESTHDPLQLPKQAPQTQGLKRKDGPDDRFIDPGATTALFISELHWWITDDDVRGWANQSQCEDELEDITFSEHKVNGKSKGYGTPSIRLSFALSKSFHILTGKPTFSLNRLKLQQQRNIRLSLLEKDSSTQRSSQ